MREKDDVIVEKINTLLMTIKEEKRQKIQEVLASMKKKDASENFYTCLMGELNRAGMEEEKILLLRGLKKID